MKGTKHYILKVPVKSQATNFYSSAYTTTHRDCCFYATTEIVRFVNWLLIFKHFTISIRHRTVFLLCISDHVRG